MHGFRHLKQQLARAQDKARIGVADTGGELIERPRHAGMRVGPEQYFPRASVALLGQRRMAHARVMGPVLTLKHALARVEHPMPVWVVYDVVEVADALLLHEIAQDIDVAVRLRIGGEDVMVRNDDYLIAVPHFGGFAKLAVEHSDGPRPADVMRHQDISLDPNIVSGLNPGFARCAGKYCFCQSHKPLQAS